MYLRKHTSKEAKVVSTSFERREEGKRKKICTFSQVERGECDAEPRYFAMERNRQAVATACKSSTRVRSVKLQVGRGRR